MDLTGISEKMDKALEVVATDVASIRAGRASPALVEKMMVEAYDTRMPMVELATISAPEPSLLVISPFDQTVLRNIEQAIASHKEMQFSVAVDGAVIRVKIPPLTSERREEFVRLLRQKLETGKVMIRQVRQEKRNEIKNAFEANEISEDAKFALEEDLQKITDEYMEKIDELGKRKEEELTSV